jgi:DNA segregation ATPase FtsK/SpoIIIE-like protein
LTTRSKAQQNVRSTDRAGTLSLSLGIIIMAFGLASMLGISAPTTTKSLALFKSLTIGIAGPFYIPFPILTTIFGAFLAVSSKRKVSFRLILLLMAFYQGILVLLTLLSSITGYGSLMDYTLNLNIHYRNHPNPASYGAYLSAAFSQFGGRADPLPGGGWLGMLLAFPLWRLLGFAGSIALTIFCMVIIFFSIISINPLLIIQHMIDKRRIVSLDSTQEKAFEAAEPDEVNDGQETYEAGQANWEVPSFQGEVFDTSSVGSGAFYEETTRAEQGFTQINNDLDDVYSQASIFDEPKKNIPDIQQVPDTKTEDYYTPAYSKPSIPDQIKTQAIPVEDKQDIQYTEPTKKTAQPKIKTKDTDYKPALESVKKTYTATQKVSTVDKTDKPSETKANISKRNSLAKKQINGEQLEFIPKYYDRPSDTLLSAPPEGSRPDTTEEDTIRAEKLIKTLDSFNIPASVQQIVHGPAITRFAIRLGEGVNVNRIRNVLDNLSLELLAKAPVRAEIPIPGTPLIGIEVANDKSDIVYLREVLFSKKMLGSASPTTVALGKDITGNPITCDLFDMPHLLIAGATGSGKSVCINSIITSILYRARPDELKLILVDPKFVELQPYNACPHLLHPVITDVADAEASLEWLCDEMDDRYHRMQELGVRNISGYNRRVDSFDKKMPFIVVIIDEMADLILTSGKEVEEYIKRITAKARAAGICLILATQRPSVNVITGVIKANIPSRIAFQVSSQVDSRTILDSIGAERLLGNGDMLYMPRNFPAPVRVQGCYISDKDVENVTNFVKSQNRVEYNADLMEHIKNARERSDSNKGYYATDDDNGVFDEKLPDAIEMAVESGQTSISMLQRVLRVGYGRAGRLIDEMERRGIIGASEGTKPRKTIMTREEYNRLVEAGDERVR